MCRNRPVLLYFIFTVMFAELRAHGAMQLLVQWFDLIPESSGLALKFGRTHIKTGAPHFTEVTIAKFTGALINELDVALILLTHRWRDRAPADPVFFKLVIVLCALHEAFKRRTGEAVVVVSAVLACAVHASEFGRNHGELFAFCRVTRGWQRGT